MPDIPEEVIGSIGMAHGKSAVGKSILFSVPKGTEGAVSFEGYAAGIIGSFILTGIAYLLNFLSSPLEYSICILSALIATTAESYIGAIGQNNKNLTNPFKLFKLFISNLLNLLN